MSDDMSLRDYFAAHAPTVVPEWFHWQSPTPYPPRPGMAELTEQQVEQFRGLGDYVDRGDCDPAVLDFDRRWREADAAAERWNRQCAQDRYIAWRFAYADLMLAQRGRK